MADIWKPCIARTLSSQQFSAYRIHYLPLDEVLRTSGGAALPDGIICTEGREEDVTEVSRSSSASRERALKGFSPVLRRALDGTDISPCLADPLDFRDPSPAIVLVDPPRLHLGLAPAPLPSLFLALPNPFVLFQHRRRRRAALAHRRPLHDAP